MTDRWSECAECGKLYQRDQLETIPDGFGCKIVPGPKSPVGWSKVSQRRKVHFMITKRMCFKCLGYKESKSSSNANYAAAAGFKRFTPPTR